MTDSSLATILTAIVGAIAAGLTFANTKTRLRLFEQLANSRPNLGQESQARLDVEKLQDLVARKLLRQHGAPAWVGLMRRGAISALIGVTLVLFWLVLYDPLAQLGFNEPYIYHVRNVFFDSGVMLLIVGGLAIAVSFFLLLGWPRLRTTTMARRMDHFLSARLGRP